MTRLKNVEVYLPIVKKKEIKPTYTVSTTLPGCHYLQSLHEVNLCLLFDNRSYQAVTQFIEL